MEGHVRRMVFDGPNITFGRNRRFFTGGLRELIEARDRHCQGPGCEVPWWQSHVDHNVDHQYGGETTDDNGDLKCPWHNQNKPKYDITFDPITRRSRWRKRE